MKLENQKLSETDSSDSKTTSNKSSRLIVTITNQDFKDMIEHSKEVINFENNSVIEFSSTPTESIRDKGFFLILDEED